MVGLPIYGVTFYSLARLSRRPVPRHPSASATVVINSCFMTYHRIYAGTYCRKGDQVDFTNRSQKKEFLLLYSTSVLIHSDVIQYVRGNRSQLVVMTKNNLGSKLAKLILACVDDVTFYSSARFSREGVFIPLVTHLPVHLRS